jgi:hypothetical protein
VARAFQSMANVWQPVEKKVDFFVFNLTILWAKMRLLCVFLC